MDAPYVFLASLVTIGPVLTLAYAIGVLRRSPKGSEQRSVTLYLGARCIGFTVLGAVTFFLHHDDYLVAIAAVAAIVQVLDVPVHVKRGRFVLALLGGILALVLVALAAVVALT
jgi:hypothetical protein